MLRLMAQKKALLSVVPRIVELPYSGIRSPLARSSLLSGTTFTARITAAGPAQIHVRARDGARVSESDWDLQAGQTVTLRPGDELARDGYRVLAVAQADLATAQADFALF